MAGTEAPRRPTWGRTGLRHATGLILLLAVLATAANVAMAARAAAVAGRFAYAVADVPSTTQPASGPVVAAPAAKLSGERADGAPASSQRRTAKKAKGLISPFLPVAARRGGLVWPPSTRTYRLTDDLLTPSSAARLAWGVRGPPARTAADPSPRLAPQH